MTEITSKPDYGNILVENGQATDRFQLYLDDITRLLNSNLLGDAVVFRAYTVATVPDATVYNTDTGFGAIIVSDETGGRTLATSDGTNWRRVSDGAIVS